MQEEKEYIIKNQKLRNNIDFTKSVLQDVSNYLNLFDPGEKLSVEKQLERYKELVKVLKETVSAFNDKYAISYDAENIPEEKVIEWELPDDPKEKVAYIKENLGDFVKKYELFKKENANHQPGQPYKLVGFFLKEVRQFMQDYKEIEDVFKTVLKKYYDAYKSFFIAKVSLQEYADQYCDGKKHKAQYITDQITNGLEKYYRDKQAKELTSVSREKSNETGKRIAKLYNDAEDRAMQRMIEDNADPERYYDYYKEEMQKVDELLEQEKESKPHAKQKHISEMNKTYGHKDWKHIDFDKGGKVTHLTSEIQDFPGDEDFLNKKIFKKKQD